MTLSQPSSEPLSQPLSQPLSGPLAEPFVGTLCRNPLSQPFVGTLVATFVGTFVVNFVELAALRQRLTTKAGDKGLESEPLGRTLAAKAHRLGVRTESGSNSSAW